MDEHLDTEIKNDAPELLPKQKELASDLTDRPACYGDPECVCPTDGSGIHQPQEDCLKCLVLRPCLRLALQVRDSEGASSMVAPVVSKVSGFLKRWSDQKLAREKGESK